MPLIFQYGSNCDESRLNNRDRLDGDAQDLGRALTVEEFEIAFNKRRLGSGSAAADLIKPRKGRRRVWGVLYEVSKAGFERLKEVEGESYLPKSISIEDPTGVVKTAKTFRVKRDARYKGLWVSAEYVAHIVKGLRAHQVPEEYVQHVIDTALNTNTHAARVPQKENKKIAQLRTLEK